MGKIVFIGHSIVKATDYGGVTSTTAFAYKIAIASGYAPADIYNKGKSSDTIAGVLARAPTDVDALMPDVCALMCSVNDWSGGTSIAAYKESLTAFVTGRKALGIKVVLFTDNMYRGTASEFGTYYPFAVEAVKEVALLTGCPVVDVYGRMCQQAMVGNHAVNYVDPTATTDKIHLSAAGNDFIAAIAMKSYHAGFFVKDPVVDPTPDPSDLKPLLMATAEFILSSANPSLTASVKAERDILAAS